jgi:Eukaryotic DNA topoisomerase I, catalytic core.
MRTLCDGIKCVVLIYISFQILAYNRANRAVAILCNHQRAVPKTHAKSMENLKTKIDAKKEMIQDAERQYKDAKHEHKRNGSAKNKM